MPSCFFREHLGRERWGWDSFCGRVTGHGLVVLERRSNAAEDSMGEITQCRITYGHGP